ncbi:hypothetical protein GGH13_009764 [Coemansia sp. S155-1]|nr:hypothetical protein LPJ71_004639 [Coemansia sp. S17]KAJ2043545.1 hypothetical protein GGH13_009764 [Coemansia sp. S155-1]
MSLNSVASSSSLNSAGFPAMPPSPSTTSAPSPSGSSIQQKCLSPAAYSTRCSSRVNLEGSWLDLESDNEDDSADSYSLRMRRKSSGASSKVSTNVGRNVLTANLKELSRRSSMHLRKLTAKMGSN